MEMTLRMPSSYVDIDREEMEYVDGGNLGTYSGAVGWAMAGLLATAGGMLAGVAGAGSKALLASAAAIFAGGPLAWIGFALVGASLYAIGTVGSSFLAAAKDAAWYMATQGHYHISLGESPFSFIVASR